MHATFIGNPNADANDETKVCEMFGVTFFLGQSVDVSHLTEQQQQKLAGNSHFEVVSARKAKRQAARAAADDEAQADGEGEADGENQD